MDYKVIEELTRYELEIEVNKCLKNGYKPVGGVGISQEWSGTFSFVKTSYVQALLKTDESNNNIKKDNINPYR